MASNENKCPDCGNQMKENGKRFDPFTGKTRPILQCAQCRRWLFHD